MSATRTEVENALIEVYEEELSDLTREQHKSLARQSADRLIQEGVEIEEEEEDAEDEED